VSKTPAEASSHSSEIIELDFDFSESVVVSEVFFQESEAILSDLDEQILKVEAYPHDELLLQALFRKIHTLKGSAGAVPGGQLFSSLAHEFEALLETLRREKIPPNAECCELFLHSSRLLKILAENLRSHREIYPEELSEVIELMTRYGSFQPASNATERAAVERPSSLEGAELQERQSDGLWLSKEQMASLLQISSEFITLKNRAPGHEQDLWQKLQLLSNQLQTTLDEVQKVPLQEILGGLFPLARQAAYELRKEVEIVALGFELEVDKFLAQDLNKAVIHMIRNSLDHGIESAEERLSLGKPAAGLLNVSVYEKGSFLYCEIADDGRGMDPQKILERALEKGLINTLKASQLSSQEILNFIFHPGFSTKVRVTTLSGRGVGMDVVQFLVTKHGGSIKIESELGKGCLIQLKIPIPKALLVERCLVTQWRDLSLAFPLTDVATISTVKDLQITNIQGQRFCQFDGHTVPLLTLHEIFDHKSHTAAESLSLMSVVFLKTENRLLGVLIDTVQHQVDLVVKPLSPLTKRAVGFKGTSLLTEDLIAYVFEPSELLSLIEGTAP
jgi:two-component system chemotaxis sensor kinase CheA